MTHVATKTSTRRVRFADSVGRELVTIFLVDLISNFYSFHKSFHNRAIEASKKQHSETREENFIRALEASRNQSSLQKQQYKNHHHHHHHHPHQYQQQNQQQPPLEPKEYNFICDFTQPISLISFKERVRLNKVHLETCQITNYSSRLLSSSSSPLVTTIQANNYLQNQSNNNNNNNINEIINNNHVHQNQQQVNCASYNNTNSQQPQNHSITTSSKSSQHQPLISVTCTIRVLNLSYEKLVTLRYTTDDWHTFTDCLAHFKPGCSDAQTDKFTATFSIFPSALSGQTSGNPMMMSSQSNGTGQPIQRIKFAIKYVSQQEIYWDNNGGLNYLITRQQVN